MADLYATLIGLDPIGNPVPLTAERRISAAVSNSHTVAGPAGQFNFGDYIGIVFGDDIVQNKVFYPIWADNTNSTGDNANGALQHMDVYTARVQVNRAPVVNADTAQMAPGAPVVIPVLMNDTDPDSDPLTIVSVSQGAHGTVAINWDNTVTYTPGASFSTTDSFTYTISDGQGNTSTGNVTVVLNPLFVSVVINDVSQSEGNSGTTAFTFTVSLSAATPNTVTVDYSVLDGTATVADSDYVAASGMLTFAPYETTKTITVLVNGDTKFEPAETFTVKLSNATNAAIADNTGLGTINNDDVLPSITINDVGQVEGNSGTTNFNFTVSLSNPSYQAITVNFATGNGSAVAPGDYSATSGTLTFNPGETTKPITVGVVGETLAESWETFNVNLSSPVNATLADLIGQGIIHNDDTTINIGDATMTEGQFGFKVFTFTITLSQASYLTVTANWATANGTATAGSDYQATSGTVTFNPGELMKTVTVVVNGDMMPEANETFFVNLSNVINAMFGDLQGLATILNDD